MVRSEVIAIANVSLAVGVPKMLMLLGLEVCEICDIGGSILVR